jgi:hypothetical protein
MIETQGASLVTVRSTCSHSRRALAGSTTWRARAWEASSSDGEIGSPPARTNLNPAAGIGDFREVGVVASQFAQARSIAETPQQAGEVFVDCVISRAGYPPHRDRCPHRVRGGDEYLRRMEIWAVVGAVGLRVDGVRAVRLVRGHARWQKLTGRGRFRASAQSVVSWVRSTA